MRNSRVIGHFAARLDPYLLLSVLLSLFATLPLLGPYFVGSHDAILAVYRFFEFDRSIQDGILVPRWAPDLFFGYGYPFFTFYAPLSYYVAEGFHLLGLGFVSSISATFALGFLLSGFFMYLYVKDMGGPWAGLLASLAYVFAPYHLVNAHFRGDLAEFFAFVWFPAILWAAGRLIRQGHPGYLALTALFYAALLATHNIMALVFSPLLAAYLAFLLLQRLRPAQAPPAARSTGLGRRSLYAFLSIALAFGLSAFFWAPALWQVKDVQIGRLANDPSFHYRTSLMHNSSFVSDSLIQDYGGRSPQGDYGYPVEMGLAQVLLAAAAVALFLRQRAKGDKEGPFFAVAALAYYAIMFPWALFLWERVPLMPYVQSPWRLLPVLVLCTSVLIGYLGRGLSKGKPLVGGLALAALAAVLMASSVARLQPRYVDLAEAAVSVEGTMQFEILSQNLGLTAAGEYLPKGVRSKMVASPLALDALSRGERPSSFDATFLAAGSRVDVLEARSTLARFRVESQEGTPFLFNKTYFPGWTAYIDGREAPIGGVGTANLMAIQVPPGVHQVGFRLEDTRIRTLGQAASLASLLALVGVLLVALKARSRGVSRDDRQAWKEAASSIRHSRGLAAIIMVVAMVLVVSFFLETGPPALPGAGGARFPLEATWQNGVTLLGYDMAGASFRPGEAIELTLYWDAEAAPQPGGARIRLQGWNGQAWGQGEALEVSTGASLWRSAHRIAIPQATPPGGYKLAVEVLDPVSGQPLPIRGERLTRPIFPEKAALLGPVFVGRGQPVTEERVTIPIRREANLENKVAFLGYDLEAAPGSLGLTTYWKGLSRMREDYSIFAHLMDLEGKVLIFNDLQPEANPYPTTLWREGEVVAVPFRFGLPPDFPLEKHQLGVGLYTPYDWKRLSVVDPAGRPVTDTIYLPLTSASSH